MKHLLPLFVLPLLTGCFSSGRDRLSSVGDRIAGVTGVGDATSSLSMLSMVGALSTAAGIVLLAITRGTRGWYPAIGGVVLCLLNWAVMTYAHALFIPVIIGTGVLALAWTYKIAKQIFQEKRKR
jgi:hypothetical protein